MPRKIRGQGLGHKVAPAARGRGRPITVSTRAVSASRDVLGRGWPTAIKAEQILKLGKTHKLTPQDLLDLTAHVSPVHVALKKRLNLK